MLFEVLVDGAHQPAGSAAVDDFQAADTLLKRLVQALIHHRQGLIDTHADEIDLGRSARRAAGRRG